MTMISTVVILLDYLWIEMWLVELSFCARDSFLFGYICLLYQSLHCIVVTDLCIFDSVDGEKIQEFKNNLIRFAALFFILRIDQLNSSKEIFFVSTQTFWLNLSLLNCNYTYFQFLAIFLISKQTFNISNWLTQQIYAQQTLAIDIKPNQYRVMNMVFKVYVIFELFQFWKGYEANVNLGPSEWTTQVFFFLLFFFFFVCFVLFLSQQYKFDQYLLEDMVPVKRECCLLVDRLLEAGISNESEAAWLNPTKHVYISIPKEICRNTCIFGQLSKTAKKSE